MNNNSHWQAFRAQRAQAKHRKIEWKLAFWEWLQIWEESGHLYERGVKKGDYVMSRPGDVGAYAAGNVRIVPCETNNAEAARAHHARNRRPATA
jgi:hypothetical protein